MCSPHCLVYERTLIIACTFFRGGGHKNFIDTQCPAVILCLRFLGEPLSKRLTLLPPHSINGLDVVGEDSYKRFGHNNLLLIIMFCRLNSKTNDSHYALPEQEATVHV